MASKDRQTPEKLIGKLIAAAGRPTASAEARQRVYAAVHERWRETTAGDPATETSGGEQGRGDTVVAFRDRASRRGETAARTWPARTLAIAATIALAAVTLTWFNADRQDSSDAALANFARTEGSVQLLRGGNPLTGELSSPDLAVRAGDTLVTGADGRVALRLGDGLLIRTNVDSRITFAAAGELELVAGTVYVDTAGSDSALSIETPFGPVTHRGTQYELRANESALRVRVREGSVAYGGPADEVIGQAGEQIVIDAGGLVSREVIAADDPEWQWVSDLATLSPADQYRLGEVLQWIARERGLELRFANAAIEARVSSAIVRGLEGFNPDEALAASAPTARFEYELRDGELWIGP